MLPKYLKNSAILLLLLVIAFVLYFPILNNPPLSDDYDWLYTVSHEQDSVVDIFTTNNIGTNEGNSYRPLVSLVFYTAYHLWELNSLAFHLLSLLVYSATAFIIFLLVQKLWQEKRGRLIALIASLFFIVLPNHTEVVAWPSVYPDLLATFLYLLSFYLYLLFWDKKKKIYIIFALVCFVLCILAKEIAISLPFVLLVYEFLRADKSGLVNRLRSLAKNFIYILWYFIIIVLFFLARFFTTGYLFGYYGRENIGFDKFKIFKTLSDSLLNMFVVGEWRVVASQWAFDHRWFVVIACLTIAVGLLLVLKKTRRQILFLYTFFVLTILPVLSLGMSPLNDEGERYFYLPSVIFCIFLSIVLVSFWKKHWKYLSIILMIVFLAYCSYFSVQKVLTWQRAGQIAKLIVSDFGQSVNLQKPNQAVVFIGVPETYKGAQVMRNAINYAIDFYYPDFDYDHYFLPIYVQLDQGNWDKQVLIWQKTEKGFYAKTIDDQYIVGGFDARRNEYFYYELRGYDYDILMSNSIWLEVLDEFWQENYERDVVWLTYAKGGLQEIRF